MKSFVKRFPTTLYKQVEIIKNPETNLFDIRIAYYQSDAVTLFEGSAKAFQINHKSNSKFLRDVVFYVESDPEITIIVIKGEFQVRTYIKNDQIKRYVIEKIGTQIHRYEVERIANEF